MRRCLLFWALLLGVSTARADEGMWLIHQLQRIAPQLQAEGLQLPLEALYNPEGGALADAVVAIDGGMGTGSMISEEGLLITNHHVAYSDICALSTPERNILEEGFRAASREEELPVAGKQVMFLRGVEDITAEATAYRDSLKQVGRWGVMGPRKLVAEMERRHRKEGLEPWCATMWGDRCCLIFHYEVYRDIRLVLAPPRRIGAFGGETDNWGWPQHKGDFALYRVYGDAEGRPAEYAPENCPIRPRKVLPVATEGIREGDFAMVIGFPGRTHRYGSSYALEEKAQKNPIIEQCRHERMEIIRRRMEADSLVHLAYSDSYFSLSNYADYVRWENRCLHRFDVVEELQREEQAIQRWVESDSLRRASYGSLLADLKRGYEARREAVLSRTWYQEAWFTPSKALVTALRTSSMVGRMQREKRDTLYCPHRCGICHGEGKCPRCNAREWQSLVGATHHIEEGYDLMTDRALFVQGVLNFTREVDPSLWGDYLREQMERLGGDAKTLAEEAFDGSFCRHATCYRDYLAQDRAVEEILADPLVALSLSVVYSPFAQAVDVAEQEAGVDVSRAEERYRDLQYAYREAIGRPQYPDANSTMRLTYGRACALEPRDGVLNDHFSTVRGYLEKEDTTNYDFVVDDRLKQLIAARDWGRWGEDGALHVNFLTDNDITGGNSGSPVLNGRGEVVGLAFDGNRESMAGDVWFHPDLARTVAVDIRYVLWLIEKYADAGYLVEEILHSSDKVKR